MRKAKREITKAWKLAQYLLNLMNYSRIFLKSNVKLFLRVSASLILNAKKVKQKMRKAKREIAMAWKLGQYLLNLINYSR
jgi:hypothetical protein